MNVSIIVLHNNKSLLLLHSSKHSPQTHQTACFAKIQRGHHCSLFNYCFIHEERDINKVNGGLQKQNLSLGPQKGLEWPHNWLKLKKEKQKERHLWNLPNMQTPTERRLMVTKHSSFRSMLNHLANHVPWRAQEFISTGSLCTDSGAAKHTIGEDETERSRLEGIITWFLRFFLLPAYLTICKIPPTTVCVLLHGQLHDVWDEMQLCVIAKLQMHNGQAFICPALAQWEEVTPTTHSRQSHLMVLV